jgi:hypothetical protein
MFTDTRGDGICRSKSNAAVLGIEVVVAFDVVVTGSVVVVGLGVAEVVVVMGGSVTAIVGGTLVVAGSVMGPSTTLRRLTVAPGTLATELFAAAFVGFFAALFDAAFSTAPEAVPKKSALTSRKTDDVQPTALMALRFVNGSFMNAFGERRMEGCSGE